MCGIVGILLQILFERRGLAAVELLETDLDGLWRPTKTRDQTGLQFMVPGVVVYLAQ